MSIDRPEPRCPRCKSTRAVVTLPNKHAASDWKFHCNKCKTEWIEPEKTQ
jgi:transposase-like protein